MAESKMKNLFQINQAIVTAGVGYNTFIDKWYLL